MFRRFVPTGQLFCGTRRQKLFAKEKESNERYEFLRPWDHSPKEQHIAFLARLGRPLPEFREIEPYFCWAERVLRRDRYFAPGDSDKNKVYRCLFRKTANVRCGRQYGCDLVRPSI
jgi:hypothetical protein